MIDQINHIGIAVNSLEKHVPFYRDVLGLQPTGIEEVPDQKVRVAMFKVGQVNIELLEPTAPDSPIARFIEKRGEGMHHIAYQTGDIHSALNNLTEKNIQLIDQQPRSGAHGSKIAFLHPKSSAGVLTELCQKGEDAR